MGKSFIASVLAALIPLLSAGAQTVENMPTALSTPFGDVIEQPVDIEYNRTKLAQKILLARDHKIGKVDGAWGGRTREAANVERIRQGLKWARYLGPYTRQLLFTLPEARAAGGLPHAGEIVINIENRRALLDGRPDLQRAYCQSTSSSLGLLSKRAPRILTIGPEGIVRGRNQTEMPWYQSLAQAYIAEHDACLLGQTQSCEAIVDNLELFVDIWGLKPAIDREEQAFEDLAAQANIALNAMVHAYATARATLDVPIKQDERIIDWLFGRVTTYKRVIRRPERMSDAMKYGHAGGQLSVLPVLAIGALVGDPRTFREGMEFYRLALRNTRVDATLREDSLSGDMALMEATASVSAMLAAGLLVENQGQDLFSQRELGRDIHDIVGRLIDHLEDWDTLFPTALSNQPSFLKPIRLNTGAGSFYTRDIENLLGWTILYTERFPGQANSKRIRDLELDERTCGRMAERTGRAPWSCFRALLSMSTSPSTLMPSPNGGLFIGYNPGCMIATRESPFDRP